MTATFLLQDTWQEAALQLVQHEDESWYRLLLP